MKIILTIAVAILVSMSSYTSIATAHDLKWRAGDTRQVGYGHCSKGSCRRRMCWAPTKPHRHVKGEIRVAKYGPKECFENRDVFGLRHLGNRK